jgi:hypothetical protein
MICGTERAKESGKVEKWKSGKVEKWKSGKVESGKWKRRVESRNVGRKDFLLTFQLFHFSLFHFSLFHLLPLPP